MVEKLHQAVLTRWQAEGGLADFLGGDLGEVNFNTDAEEIAVELLTELVLDLDGLIEGYVCDEICESRPSFHRCPEPCGNPGNDDDCQFIIKDADTLYDYLAHMYLWRSKSQGNESANGQYGEPQEIEDRDSPLPEVGKATRISFTAHTIEKTIMATTPE